MKKRILTGLLAAVMAFTVAAPVWGIKAEAKISDYWYSEGGDYYGARTKEERMQLLNAGLQIVNSAPATAHEKVKYFHDEICKRTTYTLDVNWQTANAYGSLVKGKTKCTGYAYALKMLCELADIPCMDIGGTYDGGGHAWNIVQLEDGEWYEIDCTFDDETNSYDWFLLTTNQMSKDHKRSSSSQSKPTANGTLYAYNKKAVKVGDAKYKVIDAGKAVYTEATKSAKGNIIIPETVTIGNTTYVVTSIAKNAFKGNKKIKKVTIGKNIETIGTAAFSNCPNLKSVDMSKCKVNTLSKNLFKGSKKLSRLSLNGDNVTSVGKNALKGISRKCKISISHEDDSCASLVKSLKKQGAKSCTFNIK